MKRLPFSPWLPLRFSLRTLFIVVTLFAILIGWQMRWIKQRHAYLATERGSPSSASPWDTPATAPGMLWLWGEQGHTCLSIMVSEQDDVESVEREIEVAQNLFPEATIQVWQIPETGFMHGFFRKFLHDEMPAASR